jgi:DNA invertase Pin-like site-specific DNA recombinase
MPAPAISNKLVRVRKYRRRSTNEENQPYSIEAQDARLDPFIASQDGWLLDGEYADDASGATLDRDGLQRALRDARAGLYDVLLVYRLDRLTRSIRGLLDIVDALNDAGVALVSASEHFDTHTPVGRMVMQILAVFAEFERAIIIDRVVAGMERKTAKGGWTVGPPPFGYALEVGSDGKKTGFLTPNDHAPLVSVIFDLYRHQCLGARAIANWLNDQGHRTRNGRPWSHVAVLTILRNRVYISEIYFRGTWHNAPHQPLVDRRVFKQVQRLLAERGDDHPAQVAGASDYDLAALIRCPHCNKRFLGNAANGRSGRYRYYTCILPPTLRDRRLPRRPAPRRPAPRRPAGGRRHRSTAGDLQAHRPVRAGSRRSPHQRRRQPRPAHQRTGHRPHQAPRHRPGHQPLPARLRARHHARGCLRPPPHRTPAGAGPTPDPRTRAARTVSQQQCDSP